MQHGGATLRRYGAIPLYEMFGEIFGSLAQ